MVRIKKYKKNSPFMTRMKKRNEESWNIKEVKRRRKRTNLLNIFIKKHIKPSDPRWKRKWWKTKALKLSSARVYICFLSYLPHKWNYEKWLPILLSLPIFSNMFQSKWQEIMKAIWKEMKKCQNEGHSVLNWYLFRM